jgi:hypothetical protein
MKQIGIPRVGGLRLRLGQMAFATALLLWLPPAFATEVEPNTDRRGANDTAFLMNRPAAQLCLDRCLNDRSCRSWTFVKEDDGTANCYIGNKEEHPKLHTPCCTSGTR